MNTFPNEPNRNVRRYINFMNKNSEWIIQSLRDWHVLLFANKNLFSVFFNSSEEGKGRSQSLREVGSSLLCQSKAFTIFCRYHFFVGMPVSNCSAFK